MNYISIIEECKPSQNYRELEKALEIVAPMKPKVVLEIGLDRCGSLSVWRKVLDPELLIGVDDTTTPLDKTGKLGLDAIILAPMVSQEQATFEAVAEALGGRAVDFLVIDGGHTFVEVKGDFEMYSPLVRGGGCIMLHDIAVSNDDPSFCEVQRYWKSIRDKHQYTEIIHGVGTGLIFWEADG
jgi:cephalosporin hydroxylase